jgi:hypothetical protein
MARWLLSCTSRKAGIPLIDAETRPDGCALLGGSGHVGGVALAPRRGCMESRRFDELTRQLGAVWHRRVVLAAIPAAMIALVGTRASSFAASECERRCRPGEYCADGACVPGCGNNRDCRNKHDDPCMLHECLNGVCASAIIDCLPGYECCEGACCRSGCADDSECVVFEPCWRGQCGDDGQCEFIELDPCIICEFDDDCLASAPNTTCCGGACRRPCPEGLVMSKGCECGTIGLTSMDDVLVRDDASG